MSSDEEEEEYSGARCIKCGGRSRGDANKFLICCEDDCVNVLHEECLPARCQLAVIGYFRCHHCAEKRMDELLAQKSNSVKDSATKFGNWISRAERMEVDDEGENSGASARRESENAENVGNVDGGERQEEREPLVVEPLLIVRLSDVEGRSNGDSVPEEQHQQQQQQENNGTRVLPESFSKTFMSVGRRRVLWTEDEEKALQEGVKNLWNPATRKNIPWEKILETYKDRFHSSRTASNLKDKWKTMTRPFKT